MKRRLLLGIFSALGILVLILDTKTALSGAAEGIALCIGSVIPSLFPFLVLSVLLTSALTGIQSKPLSRLGSLCGIPKGSEAILLIGLLGGYPAGAQAAVQAYRQGQLPRRTARRMLGFCSNAGPAFLFGIVAGKFSTWWAAWVLWGIHVLSALLVGACLPGRERSSVSSGKTVPMSLSRALEQSVRIMALICGWVVIFRVLISVLDRWLLWLFPIDMQVFLLGFLEMTNGCCELEYIRNEGLRFVCASAILGFGGLCVGMQTASVTEGLGTGWYVPGKIMQTLISVILASTCVFLLFPASMRPRMLPVYPAFATLLLGICIILLRKREKRSSNPAILGV
ncbi:MAG: hypothetical protein ACI4PO_06145 [Faecousia sp.]